MKSVANLVLIYALVSLASAFNVSESALGVRTCGTSADAVPFYRNYNSAVVDHWYTSDVTQINIHNPEGYKLESVFGWVFFTQEEGTAPLYHLYSSAASDNFYTMSTTERNAALQGGYVAGETYYIYPTQVCGSIPVFRLYSSSGQDNFYTTSQSERVDFISNHGYADVEITGFIVPLGCS